MTFWTASQSHQMSPDIVNLIVVTVGVLISWIGSAFIAGYRWGTVKTRLDVMESTYQLMATKEQLAGVKEDLAEIKGMFRMVPRTDGDRG
jgi:hypothetical protein